MWPQPSNKEAESGDLRGWELIRERFIEEI
jgi:hypothetical protein